MLRTLVGELPDRIGQRVLLRGTNSFDLLFRGQELVTGGQRLHEIADYERALAERGEPLATYAGYLDAFRLGMPPHGGFAIGLERWTARLAQRDNIRQTTLFPRDRQRPLPPRPPAVDALSGRPTDPGGWPRRLR